jgi:ribosomal protein S18 acetylase RimI-like enzyme
MTLMPAFRPYHPDDLPAVKRFLGERLHAAALVGFHPGDIVHWMTNQYRGRDLERHFFLCCDIHSDVLALAELPPARWASFPLVVRWDLSGSPLEREMLAWCAAEAAQRMRDEGNDKTTVSTETHDTDTGRIANLLALGFELSAEDAPDALTRRSLLDPITVPALPAGFSIQSNLDDSHAEALGIVHAAAFNSKWKGDEYAAVMGAPGFQRENELVVVAPDGQFANFLVYWVDPVSKSGLFEPVGCHPDFRRRGLTQILMLEAMRRMQAAGLTSAFVRHETQNEAATQLYASVGFQRVATISVYRKPIN